MTRWTIVKNGTRIEKSGTGIEKSGTGIEKSGTGIEKSGTGIEKSGTGIRKGFLACSLAAIAFSAQISASEVRPEGVMQIAVDQGQVSVMWNIDGNTFVGKGSQSGTYTQVSLFEISLFENKQFFIFPSAVNRILLNVSQKGFDTELITANVPQ